VATIYNEPSPDLVKPLLEKYGVQYIVVGPLERAYYQPQGLDKFDEMARQGALRVVFRNDG